MAFCKSCGIKLDKDSKFCPECGTPNSIITESKETTPISEEPAFQTRKSNNGPYGSYRLEDLPKGFIIDDRYEVREKLGQGGFGAVYRAYDRKMAVEKALKVIPDSVAADLEAMNELHNEARIMVSLNNENIVRVYDVHDTGSIKYIDMEYVNGKPLNELKLESENKKLPEDRIKELDLQIAIGLAYAHTNQVIHKDIKPQNIMVNDDGVVKIMDFGISESVRTSMSRLAPSSSSGTLVYMSPEQIRGEDVGKESDIYSFGAMIYELLSGHPPFYKGAVEYQIFNEMPKPINGVSDGMNALLKKCLEKEYCDRYSSFEGLMVALTTMHVLKQNDTVKPRKTGPQINIYSELLKDEMIRKEPNIILIKYGQESYEDYLHIKYLQQKNENIVAKENFSNQNKVNKMVLKGESADFILVEAGIFTMGSPIDEKDRVKNETQHKVTITRDFYIGKYEVTQGLWEEVMGVNPSNSKKGLGTNYPVNQVSWYDSVKFCNALSRWEGLNPAYSDTRKWVRCNFEANGYRLPTEAEWEYAARGGQNAGSYCTYAGSHSLGSVGWYSDNCGFKTHAVGQKTANSLGLYDMSGNVWEWCWDRYGSYSGSVTNPAGLKTGSSRVYRGGSWFSLAKLCRSALRCGDRPRSYSSRVGFRLVRTI